MKVVLDETSPEGREGIYYVIAAVIIPEEEDIARNRVASVLNADGRKNPFH